MFPPHSNLSAQNIEYKISAFAHRIPAYPEAASLDITINKKLEYQRKALFLALTTCPRNFVRKKSADSIYFSRKFYKLQNHVCKLTKSRKRM